MTAEPLQVSELVGSARPVGPADIVAAARLLAVTPAHVRAVLEVESRGRGFHPDTRRPVILFEPHVFHRDTRGMFKTLRPDLSYKVQGEKPYPKSQQARYDQLRDALRLDEDAALRATSWGLCQIMGFNHELAGYDAVQAFARAMARDEREQLDAFCAFLIATGLVLYLRRDRWASFAQGYNGRDYARHGYDQRLKAAFARHSGLQRPAVAPATLSRPPSRPQMAAPPKPSARTLP
jgi:hypothetical protein